VLIPEINPFVVTSGPDPEVFTVRLPKSEELPIPLVLVDEVDPEVAPTLLIHSP
jgi:hypothetical protein